MYLHIYIYITTENIAREEENKERQYFREDRKRTRI